MSKVFNGGKGGYICEKCSKLMAMPILVIKGKKGELHYCSWDCRIKHRQEDCPE